MLDRSRAQGNPTPGAISSHRGPSAAENALPSVTPSVSTCSRRARGARQPGRGRGVCVAAGDPPSTGRHLGRTAPSGVTPSPGLPRMERLLPYRQPIRPSVPDFFFKVRDTLEKKMVTFPTRKKKVLSTHDFRARFHRAWRTSDHL